MLGDVQIYDEGAFGYPGDSAFVTLAAATVINAGEPVLKALGTSGSFVGPLTTNQPTIASGSLTAGIAATTGTNTSSANGLVRVTKPTQGLTYLCAPLTAATWNTQAKYDALVGSRVLFDLTNGTYTITASDSAGNGLVVEPLDISRYPGKVRFSIRPGATYIGFATGMS